MAMAVRFARMNVPLQSGELARLKVSQGPDAGAVYVIKGNAVSIGRGEDADVMISDLKSSRNHASIVRTAEGWEVRDIGSANGILVNGHSVQKAALKLGDLLTIGETVLEFMTSGVGSKMLMAPPKNVALVEAQESNLDKRRKKVLALGNLTESIQKPVPSTGKKDKSSSLSKILLVLVAGAALWLFLGDADTKNKTKKVVKDKTEEEIRRDLASYLPEKMNKSDPASRTIDSFYRLGFREYREGNYIRAKKQFETVLQIDPDHYLARLYLENSENSINEAVEFHIEQGKRNLDMGKLRAAQGHYESVLRLLFKDKDNPKYKEAKDQLEKVEEMKGNS